MSFSLADMANEISTQKLVDFLFATLNPIFFPLSSFIILDSLLVLTIIYIFKISLPILWCSPCVGMDSNYVWCISSMGFASN